MAEIDKSTSVSQNVTVKLDFKWVLAKDEPTTNPNGYARFPDFDIKLGELGTLWCFKLV